MITSVDLLLSQYWDQRKQWSDRALNLPRRGVAQQPLCFSQKFTYGQSRVSSAEQEFGSKPIHVKTVFQNMNPKEIHNILTTSQVATHLFSRTTVITKPFTCFAYPWTPKHSASSTEATLTSNLDNHSKTCVLPTVCSPKATFNISKFSVAFSPF